MILIHALAAFLTFIVIGLAFAFFFVVPLVMLIACVGYYSILVQEIGPGEKDELPVPLRGFELRTDVWDPFVHIFFSAVACFGPAALAQIYCGGDPRSHLPVIALAAAGAFFLPAVFLTACVDGVLVNFRPDRVLGVIGKSLGNYLLIAVAWSAGTVMLVDGIVGCYEAGSWLFAWPGLVPYRSPHVFGGLGSLAMIAGGLYLSYYACWMLAIFWRKHHAEFPWIARRFVSEKPASGHPPAPLEKTAPVPPRHTS
jgi:hypothetical protein